MPAAQITETSTEVTLTVGADDADRETLLGYIAIAQRERELANNRRLYANGADETEVAWQDFDKCIACIYWNQEILAGLVTFG